MSTPLTTSIALCTYNGERFLQAQLDSLLDQTRLPDQIVAFDDASQDETWMILEAFAQQARQRGIQVLLRRQPVNVGYVRNFEAALAECSGEIVFLCDQDDVWHADKIQRMAARFEAEPDLTMLHADARLVDADGNGLGVSAFKAFEVSRAEIRAMHAGHAFDVLLKRNIATGAAMAVRLQVVRKAGEVPDGWIHDEWLGMVASLLGKADTLESAMVDYRQHGNNQLGANVRSWRQRVGMSGARGTYMEKGIQRTRALLDRFDDAGDLPVSPPSRKRAEQRLAHAVMRRELPTAFIARFRIVAREAASGRYWCYSSGLRSVLSDMAGLSR